MLLTTPMPLAMPPPPPPAAVLRRNHRVQFPLRAGDFLRLLPDGSTWERAMAPGEDTVLALSEREFRCAHPGCPYKTSFRPLNRMRDHVAAVHLRLFRCGECDSVYTNNFTLQRHLQTIHGRQTMPFRCDRCDRQFASMCFLMKHKAAKHGIE